jgi:hypothetical protein
MKLRSKILVPDKTILDMDKSNQFDQALCNLIEITFAQAVKAKKNLDILYLNFNNLQNENYVSFKFESNSISSMNTYITIIDSHKLFEWSGFGINGVLSIEKLLNIMSIDTYYIKASNGDGLGIYFWTRCGYSPVLKDQHKILEIQPEQNFTYFVKRTFSNI